MQPDQKIFKCFISSTFGDLKEERRAVIEALLDERQLPVGMENFNASDETQWAYIERMLNDTDYFIVILAHRYGSIDESGMSYTEKETRYALKMGIPVLTFIISKDASWDYAKREKDPVKEPRLNEFKEFLTKDKLVQYWVDKNELARKVASALREAIKINPRPGYIRGIRTDEPSSKKEAERKPVFTIEFDGKPEIRIVLSNIKPVEQLEILEHVKELTPGQPEKLRVSDRDVDRWNRDVPRYNREIDEYNALAEEYNRRKLAVPCEFSVANTGTLKATDISVVMEFPNWLEVFDVEDTIQKPRKPDIPVNPVRFALELMQGKRYPVQTVHGSMVSRVPDSPISIGDLEVLRERDEWLTIQSSHVAVYRARYLQHRSRLTCNLLHILPAYWGNQTGTVKIEFHCDELPEPQVMEIPVSIVEMG